MKAHKNIFSAHSRHWAECRYVYPVISRRSRGLSIGINLSPDQVCNFDCVYCQVDRSGSSRSDPVDLDVLEEELRSIAGNWRELFTLPGFCDVPEPLRRLNDIAFSGDGEPTAVAVFPEAVQRAVAVHQECGLDDAKIVVITNACFLERPRVRDALSLLDEHNGEIWAKLDAGTEDYFRTINRARSTLAHVVENITQAARKRPLVIQTLMLRLADQPPSAAEIDAYLERLQGVLSAGGQLRLIQLYTVARRPAEPTVTPLTTDELDRIADRIRRLGVPVECFV